MIQELKKDMLINNKLCRLKDYSFERVEALPIGTKSFLKELMLSGYIPRDTLNQLGREFACLIQSGQWTGILIVSENLNKYKKYDNLKKEGLFHQVNML